MILSPPFAIGELRPVPFIFNSSFNTYAKGSEILKDESNPNNVFVKSAPKNQLKKKKKKKKKLIL